MFSLAAGNISPYLAGMKTGIFFTELRPRLRMLRVECSKCGRAGRYSVDRLAYERPDGTVGELLEELTAECPKRLRRDITVSVYDICKASCPDLPAVIIHGKNLRDV